MQIVRSAIDLYAPLRQASRRLKRIQSKPWLTKGLLVSIKLKQKLYRSHFLSHDFEKQQFYKQYSNKLNKIKYEAKKSLYVDLFEECFIHNNPRKIWSTINSLLYIKPDNSSTPSKLRINDIVINNPVQLVDCFNLLVSKHGVAPEKSKIKAVAFARETRNFSEVCCFLGLVNYCGRFIPDLATISKPLQTLARISTVFTMV